MAVPMSAWAAVETGALWTMPPTTWPGGNPEIDEPGLTPRSPVTTDAPVLVTALPPRTAKVDAVPRAGLTTAAAGCARRRGRTRRRPAASAGRVRDRLLVMGFLGRGEWSGRCARSPLWLRTCPFAARSSLAPYPASAVRPTARVRGRWARSARPRRPTQKAGPCPDNVQRQFPETELSSRRGRSGRRRHRRSPQQAGRAVGSAPQAGPPAVRRPGGGNQQVAAGGVGKDSPSRSGVTPISMAGARASAQGPRSSRTDERGRPGSEPSPVTGTHSTGCTTCPSRAVRARTAAVTKPRWGRSITARSRWGSAAASSSARVSRTRRPARSTVRPARTRGRGDRGGGRRGRWCR